MTVVTTDSPSLICTIYVALSGRASLGFKEVPTNSKVFFAPIYDYAEKLDPISSLTVRKTVL